jgi:protein gp37
MRTANPKLAKRYAGHTLPDGRWNEVVTPQWDVLDKPGKHKGSRVFAVWNDLFHVRVGAKFVKQAFKTMAREEQHVYVVLTKRPRRALKFIEKHQPLLTNVIIGTSVEDNTSAEERLPALQEIAAHGWSTMVSYEPLLGPVFEPCPPGPRLGWFVVGGETGRSARPMKSEWVDDIYAAAHDRDVPFFFKSWGTSGCREYAGRTWNGTPSVHDAPRRSFVIKDIGT